jgi:predicted nucleotidyltransferase
LKESINICLVYRYGSALRKQPTHANDKDKVKAH